MMPFVLVSPARIHAAALALCSISACHDAAIVPPDVAGAGEVEQGNRDAGSVPVAQGASAASLGLSALQRVADTCLASGGAWTDHACRCDEARGLSFSSETGCQEVAFSPAACWTDGLTRLTPFAARSCLFGAGVLLRKGRTTLRLEGEAPDETIAALARLLDEALTPEVLAARLPADGGSSQEIVLTFTPPRAEQLGDALEVLPYPLRGLARVGFVGPPMRRVLHVASAEEVGRVLGVGDVAARPAASAPELAPLLAADESCRIGAAATHEEHPIIDGCAGACEIVAHCALGWEDERFTVQRTRRYHGGTAMEERLVLLSEDARRLRGLILYDYAGRPNQLAVVTTGAEPLVSHASVFDAAFHRTGSTRFDPVALGDAREALRRANESAPLGADEVAVVVCESSFGSALDERLSAALATGPHMGPLGAPEKSLFGWRSAPGGDVAAYLDGVIGTRWGIPSGAVSGSRHHAHVVASLVLGLGAQAAPTPGLRIVPMDRYTCLQQRALLRSLGEEDAEGRMRVVNLSATLPLDYAACQAALPEGLPEHFLWVVGSGNAARRFRDLAAAQNCPQALRRRANLLVVDGVNDDELASESDGGPRFSDIGAPCSPLAGGTCNGTSAAAPRVAHAAARIVARHRAAISNAMVRAAILLSARVPTGLDVSGELLRVTLEHNAFNPPSGVLINRTSGVLDEPTALRMADALVAHGWGAAVQLDVLQASTLLNEMYAGQQVGGLPLAAFKLTTLRNNGFFEESP